MGIWQEVLSTFSVSFDMVYFTVIRSAGISPLVSGFLIKGIDLYIAVELVCLKGKGNTRTPYSTTSLLLTLLFSLNLTPTKFFLQTTSQKWFTSDFDKFIAEACDEFCDESCDESRDKSHLICSNSVI